MNFRMIRYTASTSKLTLEITDARYSHFVPIKNRQQCISITLESGHELGTVTQSRTELCYLIVCHSRFSVNFRMLCQGMSTSNLPLKNVFASSREVRSPLEIVDLVRVQVCGLQNPVTGVDAISCSVDVR